MDSFMLGQVGLQTAADGTNPVMRFGRTAEAIVQQLHGRYYEAVFRRAKFSGSIVAQVTTVGTNTTYTGLCLSNPISSPVNLVVDKVGFSFIVAFAAGAHVGLMTGFHASTNVIHTTPVAPRSQFFNGSGGGVGLLDSAATLPATPTVNQIFGSGLTGAITTTPFISGIVDMEGSLVLPPGSFAAIYTSTASAAAAGAFSFQWEEVAV